MSHIFKNLYLGSYIDSINIGFLSSKNIQMVVTLAKECKTIAPTPNIHIVRHFFNIASGNEEDLRPETFEAVYQIIKAAEANSMNVLLHCVNGKHRSPSFVLYYLLREMNQDIKAAYSYLKKQRDCVDIPHAFGKKIIVAYAKNTCNQNEDDALN